MPSQVLVTGPPPLLEAVRRALPEMDVAAAPPSLDLSTLRESDCVLVGIDAETTPETWPELGANVPVVAIVLGPPAVLPNLPLGNVPWAHAENPAAIRLAVRAAVVEHRVRGVLTDLAGTWTHDARGALGVARLALELCRSSGDRSSPIQKVENGILRLGFLVERLPSQLALALDLPVIEHSAPSLFPSLESYVKHLQLVHARRPIEFSGGEWNSSAASQALVLFAAGFAELAFQLGSARSKVRFSADSARCLEVECECPNRPQPWDVEGTLGAAELSPLHTAAPYRLVEAVRLALRSAISLTVEFTPGSFVGRVQLGEPVQAP